LYGMFIVLRSCLLRGFYGTLYGTFDLSIAEYGGKYKLVNFTLSDVRNDMKVFIFYYKYDLSSSNYHKIINI